MIRPVDFIEVCEGALDRRACAALVERFEARGQVQRGQTGTGVDTALKDSWDIRLDAHPAWADAKQQLNQAVLTGLRRYLRAHLHAALAPMQLRLQAEHGTPVTLDAPRLAALDDATLDAVIARLFRPGSIHLQKYLADQGG